MEKLENSLKDILEIEEINDNDLLEDFDGWDSLAIISITALANSDFNKTLTFADIKNAKTVKGLKELICK